MIVTTNIPCAAAVSADYVITLNGKEVAAMYTRVSKMPFNRDWPGKQRPIEQSELASVLRFEADEPVFVRVKPQRAFIRAVVRPLSEEIVPTVRDGGEIEFMISRPGQYVLELDGMAKALHIFADPIESFRVSEGDADVLYYGAGIHYVGAVELTDNVTVYIDRDAIVYGAFYAIEAKNIRIVGGGVLDGNWEARENHNFIFPYDFSRVPEHMWKSKGACHVFSHKPDASILPERKGAYVPGAGTSVYAGREHFKKYLAGMAILKSGLHFYKCKNVEVSGIIINGAAGLSVNALGCDNVVFDNVKLIGMWKHNNDGIDFYNCRDCMVKNSFVRAFDDAICIKGQTGWDTESVQNILIENCVVWCDWARTLEVGVDTVAPEIKNVTFRDCDCLHHSMVVLHIGNTDRSRMENILFEDIRVEYTELDAKSLYQHSDDEEFVWKRDTADLFHCDIAGPGIWSNDNITGMLTGVMLKNIQVLSEDDMEFPKMCIRGKDADHPCRNITIENVTFNGKPLKTAEELHLQVNEYTENLIIR